MEKVNKNKKKIRKKNASQKSIFAVGKECIYNQRYKTIYSLNNVVHCFVRTFILFIRQRRIKHDDNFVMVGIRHDV